MGMKKTRDRRTFWVMGLSIVALLLAVVSIGERQARTTVAQALLRSVQQQERLRSTVIIQRQREAELKDLLTTKAREVDLLVERLQAESKTVAELHETVARQEQQVSRLQTELVLARQVREPLMPGAPAAKTAAVELEKIPVPAPSSRRAQGKILQVHPEWEFVVLDLGWDQVAIGDRVGIYRDNALIAEAQVERVQEEAAAARVLPTYQTAKIAVNDQVVAQ